MAHRIDAIRCGPENAHEQQRAHDKSGPGAASQRLTIEPCEPTAEPGQATPAPYSDRRENRSDVLEDDDDCALRRMRPCRRRRATTRGRVHGVDRRPRPIAFPGLGLSRCSLRCPPCAGARRVSRRAPRLIHSRVTSAGITAGASAAVSHRCAAPGRIPAPSVPIRALTRPTPAVHC